MKNITHSYTIGIGCIRFKHGRIRWHKLAYAGIHGEARRDKKIFLSMIKNFVRIRTYGLYDKHTLGTR
jgi:hypothetical protein